MMKWICGFTGIAGCVLVIAGALFTRNKAVTVIGGADGPTSIFIAAKPSPVTSTVLLASGIIIILGTIIIVVRNLKNHK
ncbi:oxaloacetate decarboxylase [Lacrimispora sp. 38-1]|uniref:oxaloacetate decarboxylase n=1 Tax=Lacrimispora sp. 38-1 TaxID=3125778 RepID=UPI003CE8474B